jgi:type III restriction enzyme
MSYALNEQGHFDPEYAEVYGVPFDFIPCAGVGKAKRAGTPAPGRIRAIPERVAVRPWLEIEFPRLTGYRLEMPPERLDASFGPESRLTLSTVDVATWTENAPVVGRSTEHNLEDLRGKRNQEVAYSIAALVLRDYFPAESRPASGASRGFGGESFPPDTSTGDSRVWLFPQLLGIARRWLDECLELKDSTFPGLLLLSTKRHAAAEKIHRAIAAAAPGESRVRAQLPDLERTGSTARMPSFDSVRTRWTTRPDRCHINYVVCDSDWEAKFAATLEQMDEVVAYAKNQNLGFVIPYTHEGERESYYPDYLIKINDGHGIDDPLHLIVEISGQTLEQKQAKVDTATKLWVPAVNAERIFGRWDFLEITDPHDARNSLRGFLSGRK